ncbi:MAG: UDP-2,4-diacetamido-2,4,6-trideoxy-beta-L-altropyranose hydrolase [bacterium]
MESKTLLFIRADASVSIGTGHIMRMMALGQAWQARGGGVHFLCAEITSKLEERLASEGFQLSRICAVPGSKEDLERTTHLITSPQQIAPENTRVVLDGYNFVTDYQLGIKAAGFRFLVVDDYGHADFYHADWVLNQNISAREELYAQRGPETHLLLGPQFAMLRKEFLAYQGWQRKIPAVAKNILVTLGGSDPDNVTLEVIRSLTELDLHVKVVVGGSNPHVRELENFTQILHGRPADIEVIVNATNMPELMAWADLAVAAGGSTAWELAFMGLPSIFMILADNQRDIALELSRLQMGLSQEKNNDGLFEGLLDKLRSLLGNMSRRKEMAFLCSRSVDGMGASRICDKLCDV